MKNSLLLRMIAPLAFIITIVVNAMANGLPINDLTTGEVANLYPNLFTPAGITFSIWSVIYLLSAGFLVYCWIKRDHKPLHSLLPLFIISCLLNITWILVWHYLMPALSVLVMIALLFTLARLFLRMQPFHASTTAAYILVVLPITIYFAWICVATIANITALLVSLNWNGGFLSAEFWSITMMGVASVIGFWITKTYRAPIFSLVIIWALIGIYIRWNESDYNSIIYAAIAFSVLLASNIIYVLSKKSHT